MQAYRALYNVIAKRYDCQKTEVLALLLDRPKLEAIKREVWSERFPTILDQYKVAGDIKQTADAVQNQIEESALECKIDPPVLAYINGEMENPSSTDSADDDEDEDDDDEEESKEESEY